MISALVNDLKALGDQGAPVEHNRVMALIIDKATPFDFHSEQSPEMSKRIANGFPEDKQPLVKEKVIKIKHCSNSELYTALKDPVQSAAILGKCSSEPYLWKHLSAFTEALKSPSHTAALIKAHDRRIRWQIERIYRARCDIVHAGRQVVTASLLCANLEFYLRMTLKSMLKSFSNVATLMGPAEFFERQRYQLGQVLQELQSEKKGDKKDALLIASLD